MGEHAFPYFRRYGGKRYSLLSLPEHGNVIWLRFSYKLSTGLLVWHPFTQYTHISLLLGVILPKCDVSPVSKRKNNCVGVQQCPWMLGIWWPSGSLATLNSKAHSMLQFHLSSTCGFKRSPYFCHRPASVSFLAQYLMLLMF